MKNFQFRIFNFQRGLPRAKRRLGSGFTITETLVAIAIATAAVTIVVVSLSKINSRQALDKSADLAVSVLTEAKSLTLSSYNAASYGVRIEDSQLILLPAYATTTLNQLVGIRSVSLAGGGNTVWFERLTGRTSQSGTFEIYLKNATTTYRTITINSNGIIE